MATKKAAYEAPAPASDKKKALDTALAQIEKTYGKGAVMRLGDRPEMVVDAIPTGSLALDAALGIGGSIRDEVFRLAFRIIKQEKWRSAKGHAYCALHAFFICRYCYFHVSSSPFKCSTHPWRCLRQPPQPQ